MQKVNALQEKFEPDLAQQLGRPEQVRARRRSRSSPSAREYKGDLAYFQTVADLLAENPPPTDQEAAVILLGRGGIDVGQPMDMAKLGEPARKGLARAAAMARRS